ncbi:MULTISPECIES: hypothetical protein [Flavobacteriaceae]|uniref:hypothetical protein n=1 Tax=Flavobacteriaceae TaxID=49546 RepID=UPI0014925BEB|nr:MULTISPECIES: hypothetical protein [Allomuricauda]MDC6366693.1 hypothetical protein [Muricauda sp. AC10]
MTVKKSVLSVLLLFILSNVLTTVWYMVTDDANYVPFRRSETNYLGLILNHLVFVLGFVYLFPSFIKERNTMGNALWYGVVLSGIMFIPTGLVVRSIWQVNFDAIFLANTLAHLTIGGILGLVLFLVTKKKK